jgi:cytochrome c2
MEIAVGKLDAATSRLSLAAGAAQAAKAGLAAQQSAASAQRAEIAAQKATAVSAPAGPRAVAPANPHDAAIAKRMEAVADRFDKVADKLGTVADRLAAIPLDTTPPAPRTAGGKAGASKGTAAPASAASPSSAAGAGKVALDTQLIAAGEGLFRSEDLACLSCHKLNGTGGRGGPELAGVGSRRPDVEWQTAHLKDPKSRVPGSKMPAYNDLQADQLKALAAYLASLK